jgi:hypothetical protein
VRPVSPATGTDAAPAPARVGHHRRQALLAAAIVVPLVLVAVVVFVFLPGWVGESPLPAAGPGPAGTPAASGSPEPVGPRDPGSPQGDDARSAALDAGSARDPETPSVTAGTPPGRERDAEPVAPDTAPAREPGTRPVVPETPAGRGTETRSGAPKPETRSVAPESRDSASPDDTFTRAMSAGLEALERGEYAAAREAFRRADRARPGTAEVAEALLRVEQGRNLEAIAGHREGAVAAESREDWHAAVAEYDAILALDPTIHFAREGKARCADRADIADRIDYHLAHPGRLSTDAVFEEALELLVRASGIEPAGPQHRRRVEEFDRLLDVAGTPVTVVLLSDSLTEVTVYKVGRLGAFDRRELKLRPGTYTVVGSRVGYRDVRRSLVVQAGAAPPTLTVACEEPI